MMFRDDAVLFRVLFDTMLDGMAVMDAAGHVVRVNPSAALLLNIDQETLEHSNFTRPDNLGIKLYRPDGSSMPLSEMASSQALFSGRPARNTVVGIEHPGQPLTWFLANATPILDAGGKVVGSISIFHDISQRKAIQDALEESQARYRGVLDVITRLIRGLDAPSGIQVQLTQRELDVLRLVARGCSNTEIGEHLGLAEKTVRGYVSRINSKLETDNRVQATLYALRNGIINLHE